MKCARINMDNPITNDCLFCAEKGGNEGSLLKKESQGRITAVPLEENRIQTRSTRSRQINPGKEERLPVWRTRERKEKG